MTTCDPTGRPRAHEQSILFSKVAFVHALLAHLCSTYKVAPERAKLWNYANPMSLKEQHLLSPDVTLEEAKLADGQLILLEIALSNGSWPRSQLQVDVDDEAACEDDATQSSSAGAADGSGEGGPGESSRAVVNPNMIGDGLNGLHNLGNTCVDSLESSWWSRG